MSITISPEVQRCTRCILPANYPRVTFDEEGVCNYCRTYEERWANWQEREDELIKLCREASANKKGKYSIIIGFSGGKDSSYVLHKLVKEYGVTDVLAFTFDNGFLAEEAKLNIAKMVDKLGIAHEYARLDPALEKRLYQTAIKKKSAELCMFCMNPASNSLIKAAMREKVKTILMGMSPRTEAQFPYEMVNAFDIRYLRDVVEPENDWSKIKEHFKFSSPINAVRAFWLSRINFINLPEYVDWDNKEIVRVLGEEYDWIDYGDGVPHFDCLLEPAIDFFMYQRLGVSKIVENLSVLVRRGHLTRDEALVRLEEEDLREVPEASLNAICERVDVTRDDLQPYIEGKSLDYRNFNNNVDFFRKFSWVFWISYKLGFTPRHIYNKYKH